MRGVSELCQSLVNNPVFHGRGMPGFLQSLDMRLTNSKDALGILTSIADDLR